MAAARVDQLARLAPHEDWLLQYPDRERAVLLDAAGQVITRKEGERGGIDWTVTALRPLAGRVDLITHNHPGGSSVGRDDLNLVVALNVREVNAVTAVRRYRLRRLTQIWPDVDKLAQTLNEEVARLAGEMEEARDAGKITDAAIERLFHHVLWHRVADRLPKQLSYEVERRG
jgi:hypothetical protein